MFSARFKTAVAATERKERGKLAKWEKEKKGGSVFPIVGYFSFSFLLSKTISGLVHHRLDGFG
jgi:hypothetical protein